METGEADNKLSAFVLREF